MPRSPRLALLLAPLLACASDHHVSPFGGVDAAALLRPRNDLPAQLARARREAAAAGLRETRTLDGKLADGRPFVALGFEGEDAAGQRTHATRVVTPASIALALGPPTLPRREPPGPSELLPSLLDGGAFASGADLTGDRAPDLVLRAPDGSLAIYRVDLLGATPYPVALRSPPTTALEINDDGYPDLAGAPPIPPDDPLRPELLDVAVAEPTSFRNDHPAALAFHRARAARPLPDPSAPLPARLRAALERAFHARCAGDPWPAAFQPAADLAAQNHPLPDPLAASWVRWRGWLMDAATALR